MATAPKNSRSGRRRLGRGLGSLLNTPVAVEVTADDDASTAAAPPRSTGPTSIAPPRTDPASPYMPATTITESKPQPRGEQHEHNRGGADPRDVSRETSSPGGAHAFDAAGNAPTDNTSDTTSQTADAAPRIINLALDRIIPNPWQPRQHFDDESLNNLAASIKREGLMQPILVRPAKRDGWEKAIRDGLIAPSATAADHGRGPGFELIAGERRWRAAQRIGLATIPAIVHYVDDRTAAEFSLVENIQREDLDPIERAEAFRRLVDEFGLTHEELAESVNLDRATITNFLRLNELDDTTRGLVRERQLTMTHARSLLAITNIETRADLARRAARSQWSVRETELHVRRAAGATTQGRRGPDDDALAAAERLASGAGLGAANGDGEPSPSESNMKDLQQRLEAHLGTKVQIHQGRKKGTGRVIIEFYTYDQFEGLMDQMGFDAG